MIREQTPTILYIDDEKMMRLTIGDYLEDCGYRVLLAENGREGLAMFRQHTPDIVLLDLRMPGMDGLDVLAAIHQDAPQAAVIVISGANVLTDVIDALRSGAWDYLTKPIEDLTILQAAVKRSLKHVALLRQNQEYQADLEQLVREKSAALNLAETANRELKEFAYIVSHDLKAPLRGISQLAAWLVQDYAEKFDEHGREMVNLLLGRVKRMDRLISGILQYSRAGQSIGKEASVDLNIVLRETIAMIVAPPHIHIRVDGALPIVYGEEVRLEQIFQNLIENAVKFMDKPEGHIVVRCDDGGETWVFSVGDNGPGIDANYHEHIFRLFQVLTSHDERDSTGIGLAVVKKIVELYGGNVWLESTPGEGSTFFFTLPKSPEEREQAVAK